MHNNDPKPCWNWTGSLHQGRPYFRASNKRRLAYQWVYELVYGVEIPQGQVVRHKCDNPTCCNPHHLELGTHQENMDDMTSRGRHGLSAHTVKHIRKLVDEKRKDADIAEIVGVARETVRDIRLGKRRGNLGEGE